LLQAAIDLVREAGGKRIRQFLPARNTWLRTAAQQAGFESVRTLAHMRLPADAPTPIAEPVAGMRLRSIRAGEDRQVLAALNRAWAGTWNFVEITLDMLQRDLEGQRDGMLLGVDAADHVIATCHAIYVPGERSADGSPRAWISNLTVDPDFRQHGVAHAPRQGRRAAWPAARSSPALLPVRPLALVRQVAPAADSATSVLRAWSRARARRPCSRAPAAVRCLARAGRDTSV